MAKMAKWYLYFFFLGGGGVTPHSCKTVFIQNESNRFVVFTFSFGFAPKGKSIAVAIFIVNYEHATPMHNRTGHLISMAINWANPHCT